MAMEQSTRGFRVRPGRMKGKQGCDLNSLEKGGFHFSIHAGSVFKVLGEYVCVILSSKIPKKFGAVDNVFHAELRLFPGHLRLIMMFG